MNQIKNPEIRHYFRQIKRLLPIHTKEEQQFINTLRSSVEIFVEEHPGSSIDDIINQFHSPKQVVCDYLSSLDHTRLCSLLSLRDHIKRTVGLLLILGVFACGCRLFLIQALNYDYENSPVIRTWRVEPAEEEMHE